MNLYYYPKSCPQDNCQAVKVLETIKGKVTNLRNGGLIKEQTMTFAYYSFDYTSVKGEDGIEMLTEINKFEVLPNCELVKVDSMRLHPRPKL